MIEKIKGVIKFIGFIILSIIVFISVYTFVFTQVMKNDYVNLFGFSFFSVRSGSMTGTIEVNDIIIVDVNKNVHENDIITYYDEHDDIVTHRYIKTEGGKLITQGDANNTQDAPIDRDDVIGKVIFVFSPNLAVKLFSVILIIAIFLVLINFDELIKKYVLDSDETDNKKPDPKIPEVLPQDVFSSPEDRKNYKSSGLTVSIPLYEIERMKKMHEVETNSNALVDFEGNVIDEPDNTNRKNKEKELIDLIESLLRVKNDNLHTTKINKEWLEKFQYVYKLVNIISIGDTKSLEDAVRHPSFKEIYDYDLDKIGLYENLRNRLYEMPIYVFLKILCYAVLYNDAEFFDAVFKIMKYKVLIDKNGIFKNISKESNYEKRQVKALISFMQKLSLSYDNNKVFELDRIERLVKIKGYVND